MDTSRSAVFFSYARADDESERGRISTLREKLEKELRILSGDAWDVFQDLEDIEIGQQWRKRLAEGVSGCTFFVPVLTPTYFKRPYCREELAQFLEREREMGRDDLVLPILYLNTPALTAPSGQASDALAAAIAARQCDDWRPLRMQSMGSATVRERITQLAEAILSVERGLAGAASGAEAMSANQAASPLRIDPPETNRGSRCDGKRHGTNVTGDGQPVAPRRGTAAWAVAALAMIAIISAVLFLSGRNRPAVAAETSTPSPPATPILSATPAPAPAITAAPSAPERPGVAHDEWMSSAAYQRAFEAHMADGMYPIRVEGRLQAGKDEFRADWLTREEQCAFAANHGITKALYEQYNAKNVAQGLHLSVLTTFTNRDGITKYQAVWIRDCGP